MSTLLAGATGNLTAAGTWTLCDSTSESDSEAANTALTTSFTLSSAFTPGVITIDGIAIKVATRAVSPTGTLTVELILSVGGTTVSGASVTINVSDINTGTTAALGGGGWHFLKFAAPILLASATAYKIQAKTSSAAQVNLFSTATTNWSRQLRTTTTQAPAAADKLIVAGEHTGAGTGNDFTVTMNEAAAGATVYGIVAVCKRGTLSYGVAASTNYHLKIAGDLLVYDGGAFNIGTSGTRMPANSTAVLEFNCGSAVQYGLRAIGGGVINIYGDDTRVTQTLMTADIAAAGTTLTVVSTSGWAANDVIAIPSTTRTASESENKTISSITDSTHVVIGAATNAHSGTSPTQAKVGSLTRNVKIRGVSSSLTAYISLATLSTVNFSYAEFLSLGSATVLKRGIDVLTTTGSCTIDNCSIHDNTVTTAAGIIVTGVAANNLTLSNNVLYNISAIGIAIPVTTGSSWSVTGNLLIKCGQNGTSQGISLLDVGGICTNNWCGGNGDIGMTINQAAAIGTITGNTAHSNANSGFTITDSSGAAGTFVAWRNVTSGVSFDLNAAVGSLAINTLTVFGNATANVVMNSAWPFPLIIDSLTSNLGATLTAPIGIQLQTAYTNTGRIYIQNSSFGATTAHTTADINLAGLSSFQIFLSNTTLASTTEVGTQTGLSSVIAFISSDKHDATAGNYKRWMRYGTYSTDTTIYRAASPSLRLTPNNASFKLEGALKWVAIASGATVTPRIYVRESVISDGTAYNGARIRLMLRKNVALGITTDTVIATATSASAGAFELLSGTTAIAPLDGVYEFFVDCDGTTGWINVDDFTCVTNNNSSDFKYWLEGEPYLVDNIDMINANLRDSIRHR